MASKAEKAREAAYNQQRYGLKDSSAAARPHDDTKIRELIHVLPFLSAEEGHQILQDHDYNVEQAIHSALERQQFEAWREVKTKAKPKVRVVCCGRVTRTPTSYHAPPARALYHCSRSLAPSFVPRSLVQRVCVQCREKAAASYGCVRACVRACMCVRMPFPSRRRVVLDSRRTLDRPLEPLLVQA